jgi:hypothetical protein
LYEPRDPGLGLLREHGGKGASPSRQRTGKPAVRKNSRIRKWPGQRQARSGFECRPRSGKIQLYGFRRRRRIASDHYASARRKDAAVRPQSQRVLGDGNSTAERTIREPVSAGYSNDRRSGAICNAGLSGRKSGSNGQGSRKATAAHAPRRMTLPGPHTRDASSGPKVIRNSDWQRVHSRADP